MESSEREESSGRNDAQREYREIIARNLQLARTARGITQEQLAEDSGVSRATIAQIESGDSDPRLSTIVSLADAMEVNLLLLLLGRNELSAIKSMVQNQDELQKISESISDDDVNLMQANINSGLPKGQKRAVEMGANAVSSVGMVAAGSAVGAAIGTFLAPGVGTAIGAFLGSIAGRARK